MADEIQNTLEPVAMGPDPRDEEVARLVQEDRALRAHVANVERERQECQKKLEASQALVNSIIERHAMNLIRDGIAHTIVDLLDPAMSEEEQAAVWTLIRYVNRKRVATSTEIRAEVATAKACNHAE